LKTRGRLKGSKTKAKARLESKSASVPSGEWLI
jgi:hypothetical protein